MNNFWLHDDPFIKPDGAVGYIRLNKVGKHWLLALTSSIKKKIILNIHSFAASHAYDSIDTKARRQGKRENVWELIWNIIYN